MHLTLRLLIAHIISRFIATASTRRWKTMILECVKWTATLKQTISQSSLTGLRNIGTKSTKQKHKQAVNMKSSFLRHSAYLNNPQINQRLQQIMQAGNVPLKREKKSLIYRTLRKHANRLAKNLT